MSNITQAIELIDEAIGSLDSGKDILDCLQKARRILRDELVGITNKFNFTRETARQCPRYVDSHINGCVYSPKALEACANNWAMNVCMKCILDKGMGDIKSCIQSEGVKRNE